MTDSYEMLTQKAGIQKDGHLVDFAKLPEALPHLYV